MKRKHAAMSGGRGGGGPRPSTAPEILSEEAWKVLVLGDGNLSYSLSLAVALPKSELWCTTLDSKEAVEGKYSQSHSTIKRLNQLAPRVHVLHGIDALAIWESLTLAEDGGAAGPFHHIIFNHPHTGYECAKRHQALCAHFLDSCKRVLAPGGLVHVTLAGDQEIRWKLAPTAARLGYVLHHKCDFYLQFGRELTAFEVKRHQSGKSFRARGLKSVTYSFMIPHASETEGEQAAPSEVVKVPWRHTLNPAGEQEAATETAEGSSSSLPAKSFPCDKCERAFHSIKDLGKHKRVHEEVASGRGFTCEQCQREFAQEKALQQHMESKHGDHPDLKPAWYSKGQAATEQVLGFRGAEEPQEVSSGWVQCPVCCFYSPSDVDHDADLRPPERPVLRCEGCAREFHEDRALLQHTMACKVLHPDK